MILQLKTQKMIFILAWKTLRVFLMEKDILLKLKTFQMEFFQM